MKKGLNHIIVAVMLLLLSFNAMAQTPPAITGTVTSTSAICSGYGTISINSATGAAPYDLVNSDLSALPVGAVVGGVNHTPTFTSGNPHYLQLTPANNDKRGFITFAKTTLKPSDFIATFGLYVGNGTGADGTSFNYGKVNTSNNDYGETGMIDSGLAVGFNDYSNKIIIYYNKVQLTSFNVQGTLNGSGWKPVSIEVDESGKLTLSYNGYVYCTLYQLPAAYISDNKTNWQYGFAARCGGLNNLHAINDVVIKDNMNWEYSLDGNNYFYNNEFNNLIPGTYQAYARIGSTSYNAHGYNTTTMIGTQTITGLSVAATLTPTNPTTCTATGTIAISNVTHNILPYDLVNLSLTNQQLGGAYIGNLGTCCNPYWGAGDLVLTPNTSNRAGFIAFGTNEAQPNAFSANYDVFVGGGNGGDGISFNYGVLNTVGTAGAAESGMVNSGLAIGFSEYSNTIKIYYNKIELQSYSATLNTGSYKSVAITVTKDGKITIVHGGITICSNYQLPAAYVADNKDNWQYALAARCGGSNNYHSVKNVVIKDNDIQYMAGDGTATTTATTITGLGTGTYTIRARQSNGAHCGNWTIIGTATITYTPDITATVASTSPTTCTSEGGTVTISNVSHGLSSPYDLVNISLTNQQGGSATFGNLGTCCGPYWGAGDLVLTPPNSNRAGYIAFATTVAKPNAFAANYDVFVGGGNGGDGLSFNYGVLNTAGTAGAAESGMVNSGLAIGFSDYSNTIKIYYNKIELQSYSATVNAGGYKSVAITVTYDGKLTIVHGGTTICSNYQLPAAYATDNKSSWQYALAARCGASNNYHSVKNVVIKDNSIQYTINGQYYTEDPHFTNVYPATYNVRARISNGTHCSILSSLGSVTITPPPGMVAITGQPDTTTRSLKLNAAATTLSVTATGADTLRYQWYSNTTANINGGNPILGATSASYTPATTDGGTFYYYCIVSNACSNVTSAVSGGIIIKTNFSESCIQDFSASIMNTIAIKTDGSLWAWGYNNQGQLGDGTTNQRAIPTRIGTAKNWKNIYSGENHTIAIKTDGTLWAWGDNTYGQIGDGTTVRKENPVQIGTATNWKTVIGGRYHTIAIKTDGTLWAWGANGYGSLGDNTTTDRLTPVQIGTATNWASISAGSFHTIAIKTDGTLWAWGANYDGMLGNGTFSGGPNPIPIQIGNATNWKSVSSSQFHNISVKTDGTLWAWGVNYDGQLGDGTTTKRNSPVQIGTANNWASIETGWYHTTAIKTDGTLWAWGRNNRGQLGDGSTTYRNSPVQIGITTDWSKTSAGFEQTTANKTDGSLWVWGRNDGGLLGDGTTTDKTSPIKLSSCVVCTPTVSSSSITICPSQLPYSWNGLTFTAAGTQTKTGFTNATGCDSTASLTVIVTLPPTAFSYSPNGFVYFANDSEMPPSLTPSFTDSVATLTSGLQGPTGVVLDADGNIYESDNFTSSINKIAPNGTILANYHPTGNLFLNNPQGLAIDAQGNVYAGGAFGKILKFDHSGNVTQVATSSAVYVQSIVVHPNGKIYITQTAGGGSVKQIETNGTVTEIASGLNFPNGITLDAAGHIYITEGASGLIKKIDLTAGSITTIASGFIQPCGIVLDAAGNIYVVDKNASHITKIATNGTKTNLGYGFHFPAGLTLDNLGNVYIADNSNNKVKKIFPNSAIASYSITPTLPAGLSFNTSTGVISGNPTVAAAATSYTVTASNNCGSTKTTTVNLTVLSLCPSTSSSNSFTICSSALPYSWNGLTFTAAGTKTKTGLINAAGCDSSATLTLIVKATSSSTSSIAVNASQLPYSWNGLTFTAAGTQIAHLTNAAGCDSAASLTLSVTLPTTPAISGPTAVCVGATISLSANIPGGVWSVQQTSNASISSTGVLSAKYQGGIVVNYKVLVNGVSKTASFNVTINAIPVVPTIAYAPGTPNPQTGAPTGGFCVGKVFTVVGTPNSPAGVWSATGFASITIGGVVSVVGTGAGSIKYTYTSAAGCSNSRTMSGTGYTCVRRGVVDGQLSTVNDFTMYPNPAKGSINLNIETLVGKGSIVVTDLYGKTVKTQNLSIGTNTVDIANLSKGMYFVSTITNEGKTTKKLVVE